MSNEEVEGIKEIFTKIDTDNDGIVTTVDLKAGLQKSNAQLGESEVQMLIEAVRSPLDNAVEIKLISLKYWFLEYYSRPRYN